MMKKIKTFIRRPFLFVAAGIALTAFAASCSKNENTEVPLAAEIVVDNTGGTPKNARLECDDNGNFALLIYTESDENNFIRIQGNTATHRNKEIDLTTKENPQAGKRTWSVDCKKNGKTLFAGSGDPQTMPVFKAGKLTVDLDVNTGNYNVTLAGGKIQAANGDNGDGKEHTLHIKTAGKAVVKKTTDMPKPEPMNDIRIDGEKFNVLSAELLDKGKRNFMLYLYTSADKKDYIRIVYNKDRHNNKEIDLTKKEENQNGLYNYVVEYKKGDKIVFTGAGSPDFNLLFQTGKLKFNIDVAEGDYSVTLTNGKLQTEKSIFGDGNEHTVTIDTTGKATLKKS